MFTVWSAHYAHTCIKTENSTALSITFDYVLIYKYMCVICHLLMHKLNSKCAKKQNKKRSWTPGGVTSSTNSKETFVIWKNFNNKEHHPLYLIVFKVPPRQPGLATIKYTIYTKNTSQHCAITLAYFRATLVLIPFFLSLFV